MIQNIYEVVDAKSRQADIKLVKNPAYTETFT